MSHLLFIYHSDSKTYEKILSKRLPHLQIRSAVSPEDALGFLEEAEIILSWQMPDPLLNRAKKMRWFASLGAGNEHLIENPNLPKDILFTKVTVYGEMMAEYVFAYLLYLCRDLPKYLEDQRHKGWKPKLPGRLHGKVMGILGLGAIGKEIALRAKQFGMSVLGVKKVPGPVENVDQVFGPDDLGRMIPLVDCLINALPLTPETFHILGEKEFKLMKEGSLLFSIGRGKTIDEGELVRILKTGKIRAVLDVFENEPLPTGSELWNMENVIITPHVSGINIPEEICEEFINNYKHWVRGEPLHGLVDRRKGY